MSVSGQQSERPDCPRGLPRTSNTQPKVHSFSTDYAPKCVRWRTQLFHRAMHSLCNLVLKPFTLPRFTIPSLASPESARTSGARPAVVVVLNHQRLVEFP